jgi:hypothetical protein
MHRRAGNIFVKEFDRADRYRYQEESFKQLEDPDEDQNER